MHKIKDIYTEFKDNKKYYTRLLDFLRDNTTIETGGNKIFDGSFKHLLHIPDELAQLIFFLKKDERLKKRKIKKYLEVGFNHGIANTILNKFFAFEEIVALEIFGAHIIGQTLLSNLRFKNLTIIASDSKANSTIERVKKFEKFDLIFIDADHTYNAVKSDFNNYVPMLNKKGVMVMHDIHFPGSGSEKFWNELKTNKKYKFKEIVCRKYKFTYGLGIVELK
tara:strand:+ start:2349 stop:3014 length:666 start_codon:yes stop_codon:yes gene_type:complete